MKICFGLGLLLSALFVTNGVAQQAPLTASTETQVAPAPAMVIGHRNPDMDSIASAIAVSDLMTRRGVPCVPVKQGKLTPDAAFVLTKFGLPVPETVTDATGRKLILTDHSEVAQSPDNLSKADILGIIDHHKLGGVATQKPLEIWVWPVGSTCTVIIGMYDHYRMEIPKGVAGAMLCAILSDTVMFKSATTTPIDRRAAEKLAKIEGIKDYMGLGMEVFKVKADLDGTSARELLVRDYKDFTMNGKKVGIGQIEVMDLANLDKHKASLRTEMALLKTEKGLSGLFLMLTDIMKEGTELLVLTDDGTLVERAFGHKPQGDQLWLPGVMSRKKEIVPKLEKAFAL